MRICHQRNKKTSYSTKLKLKFPVKFKYTYALVTNIKCCICDTFDSVDADLNHDHAVYIFMRETQYLYKLRRIRKQLDKA